MRQSTSFSWLPYADHGVDLSGFQPSQRDDVVLFFVPAVGVAVFQIRSCLEYGQLGRGHDLLAGAGFDGGARGADQSDSDDTAPSGGTSRGIGRARLGRRVAGGAEYRRPRNGIRPIARSCADADSLAVAG